MPCLRHSSVTTAAASASFKMPMICSSENCFRLMSSVSSDGPDSSSNWRRYSNCPRAGRTASTTGRSAHESSARSG